MTRSEIKKKAQHLLHKNYGHWSTLVMIPFIIMVIYSFVVFVGTIDNSYSSYDYEYEENSELYRSWQDDTDSEGNYYNDDYMDGYDAGYDDGYYDGYDDAYYDYEDDDGYFGDREPAEEGHNINYPLDREVKTLSLSNTARMNSYDYGYYNVRTRTFSFLWFLFVLILTAASILYQGMLRWAGVDNAEGMPFSLRLTFTKFFKENGRRAVTANLLVALYTFLWSLLLWVPGIVKQISYSMTNYLLRKDESLTAKEAIDLSKELMKGYKMEYFMFTCSFVLWYFASFFSGGIALFYVIPYYSVSEALFFDEIVKEKSHLFSHELADGYTDF
ncbi:DUF975 family protein [Enterococcus sp. BWR-S5]|uniref:DUF975 family protein n=1 Tax=Enterococcus sp. BWR-S5 TaxID=2787714 RepID=UPI001921F0C1|nr:DUF975 family protein [Enterococcus sp. BWR-S5]MBL1226321.1 DUF975 family protein [Enterococcus sp. BWR-S5]